MVVRRELAAALLVAVVAAAPLAPARAAGEDEALKQAAQAIKSGKGEAAIKFISNVLAVKGLPPALIAKGYYLRGLAYQKSGRPAQALADLSQALWLKQLSAGDAADAQKIRAAALGEVGKAIPAGGPEKVAAADPAVVSEPAAAPAADGWSTEAVAVTAEPVANEPVAKEPVVAAAKLAKRKAAAEPSGWTTESVAEPRVVVAPIAEPESADGVGGFFSSLFAGSSPEPATQSYAPVAQAEPAAAAASGGWSPALAMAPADGGDVGTPWLQKADGGGAKVPAKAAKAKPKAIAMDDSAVADGWQVAAVEPAAPVAVAAADPQPQSGGGFLSDFSNSVSSLFGGDTAAEAAADQTASIAKPKQQRAVANGDAWSSEVAGAEGGDSVYAKPAKDPSKLSAAVEPAAGRYLLQVASALSAAEAQEEAARIAWLDPALAAQVEQRIVAKDLGAGGKFFNVHMGPFASEQASLAACNRLKKMGIGCFPVIQ